MRRIAAAFIFLPITAFAEQAPATVQALAAMLQECSAREANARIGVATFQADIVSLKVANENLKKQLRSAQDDAAVRDR